MNLDDPKTRLWLSSGAGVALVAAILIAANVVSHFVYLRLDLSLGRVYSISPASKKLIRSLPDPVNIKVFVSHELPPEFMNSKKYVLDILKEYKSGSGGRVRTKVIEVGEKPEAREEAMKAGVSPVRFTIAARDKFEQREGFLGLVIQYQDKRELMPFLQDVKGLEYDITSRIKTMSSPAKPVVGFVTTGQATASTALEPSVAQRLRERFDVRDVDLASISVDSGVAADVGTLFVLGPQSKLGDKELYLLDQYLLSGRSLAVAYDAKRIDMRSFMAMEQETGLAPFLKHHGLGVEPHLVLDEQCQVIQVQQQMGMFTMSNLIQYPYFILASDLNRANPVTKGFEALTIPFASPIMVSTRSAQAQVEYFARSSKGSWMKTSSGGMPTVNPFQIAPPEPSDPRGPFVIAASVSQPFEPFFKEPPAGVKPKAPLTAAARPGRLAVVGTSRFVSRELRSEGNLAFFLNLTDWLAQDEDLISIRSKEITFRPLREVSPVTKQLVRYLNMFLPSILAVALGLWRWKARSARRRRVQAEFGQAAPSANISASEVAPA